MRSRSSGGLNTSSSSRALPLKRRSIRQRWCRPSGAGTRKSAARNGSDRSSTMAIHAANFRELKIDGLSREFGKLAALREVNLTIRQGEFIALLARIMHDGAKPADFVFVRQGLKG